MEAKSKFVEEADVLMGQLLDLSKKHKENKKEYYLDYISHLF